MEAGASAAGLRGRLVSSLRPQDLLLARDATAAGDAFSVLLNLARAATAPVALVATRTSPAALRRTRVAAVVIDGLSEGDVAEGVREAVRDGARVVLVECLHALEFASGVCPTEFVKGVLGMDEGVAVCAVWPVGVARGGGLGRNGEGVDAQVLAELAHVVVDLAALATGVAVDVDGLVRVAKEGGRWRRNPATSTFRYRITDSSVKFYC